MNSQIHTQLTIGSITAQLVRKRIKHMHLRIKRPDGRVQISAPLRMGLDTIRAFALSKLGWIIKQQTRLRMQPCGILSQPLSVFERRQMMRHVRSLLDKWEPIMGVEVQRVTLQAMTTRWGSCTPLRRRIRLNTELFRRSPECLEYVLVHELAHFFARGHGAAFKKVMDRYLPNWRELRAGLNKYT